MSKVIGIHFVCKDDRFVTDNGDGTFETGFWVVARKHLDDVEYVALHESKDRRSRRHGTVTGWHHANYEGRERVVFHVRQEGEPRRWVGGGTGERGYKWE